LQGTAEYLYGLQQYLKAPLNKPDSTQRNLGHYAQGELLSVQSGYLQPAILPWPATMRFAAPDHYNSPAASYRQ